MSKIGLHNNSIIRLATVENCCGCGSCMQECHQDCIFMCESDDGFMYPVIDAKRCVQCKSCVRVCPVLHERQATMPLTAFALRNHDDEIRRKSSSGGTFYLLAMQTIKRGGVVFGASFDKDFMVRHTFATTEKDIEQFLGSKYVQSDMGDCMAKAKEFLEQGRPVLFSGTPCQIAGLKAMLHKDYDMLTTVDVMCHGVPSPAVWRHYLKSISKNKSISKVNFRDKSESWRRYNVTIDYKGNNDKTLSQSNGVNPYMRLFLNDVILRPSCHRCKMKNGTSGSDITIADFWGIENILPGDDDKGTSLVLVNTEKGRKMIEECATTITETSAAEALKYNPAWSKSYQPHARRALFFRYFRLFCDNFQTWTETILDNSKDFKHSKKLDIILFIKDKLKIKINENWYHNILSV